MIKPVIDYINVLVKPLGFNKLYGLVDQLTRDGVTIPACYDKKGDWKHLGMDKHFGSVYHRILSRDEVTREDGPVPGNDMVTRSWQMRMVAVFERNIYDEDSQYVADKMLTNLFRQVEHNNIKSLATQYGIMSVTTQAGGQSEGIAVWEQEFIGADYPYSKELVIVAQDYSISLRGAETCFTTLGCGDEEIDVTQAIVAEYCDCNDATVENSDASYSQTVASGGTLVLADMTLTDPIAGSSTFLVNPAGSVAAPQNWIVDFLFRDDETDVTFEVNRAGTLGAVTAVDNVTSIDTVELNGTPVSPVTDPIGAVVATDEIRIAITKTSGSATAECNSTGTFT